MIIWEQWYYSWPPRDEKIEARLQQLSATRAYLPATAICRPEGKLEMPRKKGIWEPELHKGNFRRIGGYWHSFHTKTASVFQAV